ncbi:phosphopyruvate hydratase, partial [Curtobacterium albidum]|nr:phosphopyruvate hydratase [Curtobacterium albidum]
TTSTGHAPAAASTCPHEAAELPPGASAFRGRLAPHALHLFDTATSGLLTGRSSSAIRPIDAALAELDGTTGYRRLGGNSVVATSIAASRTLAHAADLPLWQWIAEITGSTPRMPVPHFNVLNGGAHAANKLDFQEF